MKVFAKGYYEQYSIDEVIARAMIRITTCFAKEIEYIEWYFGKDPYLIKSGEFTSYCHKGELNTPLLGSNQLTFRIGTKKESINKYFVFESSLTNGILNMFDWENEAERLATELRVSSSVYKAQEVRDFEVSVVTKVGNILDEVLKVAIKYRHKAELLSLGMFVYLGRNNGSNQRWEFYHNDWMITEKGFTVFKENPDINSEVEKLATLYLASDEAIFNKIEEVTGFKNFKDYYEELKVALEKGNNL